MYGLGNEVIPISAVAYINGSKYAPHLKGYIIFRDINGGVEVSVNVFGLPKYRPAIGDSNPIGPHGFHIHENGSCMIKDTDDPYTSAGSHWNPDNQPHGNHAGDLPVLFSNNGVTKMTFFTNRFKVKDIIGKSVIIHQNPDDYRTQPAGNAGKRIGCGIIRLIRPRF